MFNILTFEVDYVFKQSVKPPQIFRICLVVFVVGKRKIISGVIFDVESESEIRISLSRQDFEIFEIMCSKRGFSLLLRLYTGRKKFFWFFSQMSSFSTTLSLQNELLNSHERFFSQ